MLPQPRSSKKSKRNSKRKRNGSLLNETNHVARPMETINTKEAMQNMSSGSGDMLDLFDFATESPPQSPSADHNMSSGSVDILDLFNNVPPTKPKGHYGVKSMPIDPKMMQIDPKLMQSANGANSHGIRESRSLHPDKLFDVSMWQSFDDKGSPKTPSIGPSNNNLSGSFETMDHSPKSDDEKAPSTLKIAKPSKPPPVNPRRRKKVPSTPTEPKMQSMDEDQEVDDAEAEKEEEEEDEDAEKRKNETNTLDELHRGAALLKYPRRSGFPHFKHIQLSADNLRIEWFSKRKKPSQTCIWVKDIREVVRGQETEVFKKFHQKTLEKSSFSVVYGPSYRTLDVAAKSIDECEMWVKSVEQLMAVYKQKKRESDLTAIKELFVGIKFKDRNRPKSRQGSGHFIRANSSKNLKIDPVALREIEKDMDTLSKAYAKTILMSQKPLIQQSNQYQNIQYVLSELEERIEELTYEVSNIRDTELAKREVWRANVDLSAIQEKVEVLLKHLGNKSDRRRSNFI